MRISLIIITSRMPVLRTEHSLYTSEYWVGISDSIILCCDRINIFLPSLTIILPTIALSYVKWLQCCSQPHTGPRAPSLPFRWPSTPITFLPFSPISIVLTSSPDFSSSSSDRDAPFLSFRAVHSSDTTCCDLIILP